MAFHRNDKEQNRLAEQVARTRAIVGYAGEKGITGPDLQAKLKVTHYRYLVLVKEAGLVANSSGRGAFWTLPEKAKMSGEDFDVARRMSAASGK